MTIKLMQKAGEIGELDGKSKKQYVLTKIREELKLDPIIEDIIIDLIDILVQVENGQIVINPKIKKSCLPCIDFLKKI